MQAFLELEVIQMLARRIARILVERLHLVGMIGSVVPTIRSPNWNGGSAHRLDE